jgi:AcrR family transcriptional regulator
MGIRQRRTDKEIIQERAIKTRERLLAAALELYMVKGYHNTSVDEIAKAAGLSTGIAYRYFKNKKELLLAALSFSFENIKDIAGVSEDDFFTDDISGILTAFERIHTEYRAFHEELEGLRHSDEDVRKLYADFTGKALYELFDKLPEKIREKNHSWERLNISIGLMENYCHAYMDNRLNENELKYMREETIRIVEKMMWEDKDDF